MIDDEVIATFIVIAIVVGRDVTGGMLFVVLVPNIINRRIVSDLLPFIVRKFL